MAKTRQEAVQAADVKRPSGSSRLTKLSAKAGKETAPAAASKRPGGAIRMAKPSESKVSKARSRPKTASLLQAGPSKQSHPKKAVVVNKAASRMSKNGHKMTPKRIAKIVRTLNNERGSTLESIRNKASRCGHEASTADLKKVLAKAVNAKLLKEVHEERFSLTNPPSDQSRPVDQPSTSASSGGRRKAPLPAQSNHKAQGNHKACSGEAADPKEQQSVDAKKRRMRRPPQGRRPMEPGDKGRPDDDDDDDDDDSDDSLDGDKGTGDADLDEQLSDDGKDDITHSEPMSGFESVKVFGTY